MWNIITWFSQWAQLVNFVMNLELFSECGLKETVCSFSSFFCENFLGMGRPYHRQAQKILVSESTRGPVYWCILVIQANGFHIGIFVHTCIILWSCCPHDSIFSFLPTSPRALSSSLIVFYIYVLSSLHSLFKRKHAVFDFLIWLISPNTVDSSSIHFPTNDFFLFLFMAE